MLRTNDHRRARHAVALALAVLTAAVVARAEAGADQARRSWGETRPVVVARRDLRAGEVVRAEDVVARDWPAAVVPRGALADAPVGRALRADVVAGEALVAARVAGAGTAGTAAAVPDGWRAIAVVPGAIPELAAGAVVDVYAIGDPAAGEGEPRAARVANGARVLAIDDGTVTIAVPEALVARVSSAAASGAVSLAVVPGG